MALFNMLKTTFRNLLIGPATIRYPFVQKPTFEATRGRLDITISDCIFCGICQKKCPTHAISVVKTEKSWTVDRFSCITCGACVEACPKKCIWLSQKHGQAILASDKSKSLEKFTQNA